MRALEKYYAISEVALLLGVSKRWVWDRIARKLLGDVVELDGGDVRIPASGVNSYLESRKYEPPGVNGIAARTTGALRRKVTEEAARLEQELTSAR